MAGIYIHIPFCRKACHYCDFHFSTSFKTKEDVLKAISLELQKRKQELNGEAIQTIYFGGGTPSLLTKQELAGILQTIHSEFSVSSDAEITLEANPEDIDSETAQGWKDLGVNRLSIGIQSFDDKILTWMNRAHNAEQAMAGVSAVQNTGITNITIDLIYGVHSRSQAAWEDEIERALRLNVPHISAYCLTIEPDTVFGHQAAKGKQLAHLDENSSQEFLALVNRLSENNINLYEVSNFSKPYLESKHNSNYWNGLNYLGAGPGAHSFVNDTRRWNVSNNAVYSKAVQKGDSYHEQEQLSASDKYNEYIMTNLRRVGGVNLETIEQSFQLDFKKEFNSEINAYLADKKLLMRDDKIRLTLDGFLLADRIASDFFITDE